MHMQPPGSNMAPVSFVYLSNAQLLDSPSTTLPSVRHVFSHRIIDRRLTELSLLQQRPGNPLMVIRDAQGREHVFYSQNDFDRAAWQSAIRGESVPQKQQPQPIPTGSTVVGTPYEISNPKDHEGWLTHLLDDNQWHSLYTIIDTQDPTTSVMLMFPDNPVRPPNHSAPLINTNEPTLCICSHQAAIWHQYHLCIYRMRSCLTLRAPLSHRYVMYSLIESSIDD